MATYIMRRWATNQNEYDTEQSVMTRVILAESPQEAAMHVAGIVYRQEIQRRIRPLVRQLAAAPTAGSWEHDRIRYTLRKIED